jgi:hypothetical protein
MASLKGAPDKPQIALNVREWIHADLRNSTK